MNRSETGGIEKGLEALNQMKPDDLISEAGLARIFRRIEKSVKRARDRQELPPFAPMFGGNVLTVRKIIQHIERRIEASERDAVEATRRVTKLSEYKG